MGLSEAAFHQTWASCEGADLDQRIPACTTLIQSGQTTPDTLSEAFGETHRCLEVEGDSAVQILPHRALVANVIVCAQPCL